MISLSHFQFPEILRQSPWPPARLFIDGKSDLLQRPALAIVGSRRPSHYGLRAAHYFGRALADLGWVVVSGLARGIDAAAHEGALSAGGDTIAVLGHGLDRVYPAAHRPLAARIREQGLLLTEYEPGTPPLQHHFPARNRIIAGLTLGVLVVQATPRSGSLITARLALEAGREVFAVPGAFDDAHFAGSHWLLQQGAKLVTTPADLAEELPAAIVASAARFARPAPLVEESVESALAPLFQGEARSLAELAETSSQPLPQLLLALESARRAGLVTAVGSQHFVWTAGLTKTRKANCENS